MPLTVEPSKPRLRHDKRFLNLWIRDLPFKLDYVSDLPRYFQTNMDDKSGYRHVELPGNSRQFFGLQWQGKERRGTLFKCLVAATSYIGPSEYLVAITLIIDKLHRFLLSLNLVRLRGSFKLLMLPFS